MKKRNKLFSLITLILALAFPLFADASTTEFKQSDVKPGTYIVGTHMFTNDGDALTIEMLMLAARTINGEDVDLDDMIIYFKDFNENWVSGSTGKEMTVLEDQSFEIEHIDDREVKGTIENSDYDVEDNIITVTGSLKWADADDTKQNGRLAGYYSKGITITAPKGYTKEFLSDNASVKFSDRDYIMNWEQVTFGDEDTYFTYWPRFLKEDDSHTVTVTWEEGNVQIFTINLEADIEFEETIESVKYFAKLELQEAFEEYNEEDYIPSNWEILEQYYDAGIEAIEEADKIEDISTSVSIDNMDSVRTKLVITPSNGETLKAGDKITVSAKTLDGLRIMLYATKIESIDQAKNDYYKSHRVFSARLDAIEATELLNITNENGEITIEITTGFIEKLKDGTRYDNGEPTEKEYDWEPGDYTTWLITPETDGVLWDEYATWDGSNVGETLFNFIIGTSD